MPRFFGAARGRQPGEEVDVHSILEARTSGGSVRITARFEGRTWQQAVGFARRMGYSDMKELLPMLFSYGVSDEEGADIEGRRPELYALGRKYAAMKFEAYRLFNDNRALSMALSTLLPENRRLRRLAAERGLLPQTREEWDEWAQEDVDRFYQKYVYSIKGG